MALAALTQPQIEQLVRQGCACDQWENVRLDPDCDLSRIRNVIFSGAVTVGANAGSCTVEGVEKPCGLFNAALHNCEIGDSVRIANIGSTLSNYIVEADSVIENVASVIADEDADFGNGVEVAAVNEAGGRETLIHDDLNAQTAYLQAMLRHDAVLTENLSAIVKDHITQSRSSRGSIGVGSRLLHCGTVRNVNIGPFSRVEGTACLEDGSINSCEEHPTVVGSGVQARHFVLSEGASVTGGAVLEKVFVGQGAQIGKQYSAENSLFFANCEGFHGEAVSVFGGPYTVTHHKSTLLIAGLFSFYNAGSGTNQSNHMYKLGPVHQGVLERGCKTGSFSYLLMESHIGAFSVVIGKHYTNINTPNLPFSYIHEEGGASRLIPGMNLFAIGTVRDGEKWPARDRRKAPNKRDLIIFNVFSPYTVEKMRRGRDELLALSESTSKDKPYVVYGGVQINRLMLKKGAKYYSLAIARYLNGKLWERLAASLSEGKAWQQAALALTPPVTLSKPQEWTDVAGLLTPRERLAALCTKIRGGAIKSYAELQAALKTLYAGYASDEWEYVSHALTEEKGVSPDQLTAEQAADGLEAWKQSATSLHALIAEDARKEFSLFSQIGYGLDLTAEEAQRDFEAVRGTIDSNSVIQKLAREEVALQEKYTQWKQLLESHK